MLAHTAPSAKIAKPDASLLHPDPVTTYLPRDAQEAQERKRVRLGTGWGPSGLQVGGSNVFSCDPCVGPAVFSPCSPVHPQRCSGERVGFCFHQQHTPTCVADGLATHLRQHWRAGSTQGMRAGLSHSQGRHEPGSAQCGTCRPAARLSKGLQRAAWSGRPSSLSAHAHADNSKTPQSIVSWAEVQKAAQNRGLELCLWELGPLYRISITVDGSE